MYIPTQYNANAHNTHPIPYIIYDDAFWCHYTHFIWYPGNRHSSQFLIFQYHCYCNLYTVFHLCIKQNISKFNHSTVCWRPSFVSVLVMHNAQHIFIRLRFWTGTVGPKYEINIGLSPVWKSSIWFNLNNFRSDCQWQIRNRQEIWLTRIFYIFGSHYAAHNIFLSHIV